MLKILIADDHEIVRRGLKQILLEGFAFSEITEANDCPSLVEKAVSGTWDIIVSDLAMPGGGGLEALKQVKKTNPELPVLILSIYPDASCPMISGTLAKSFDLSKKRSAPNSLHC